MPRYIFPGESTEYEQKRQELLAAETSLRDQVERVAQLRRALPLGMAVPDYVFREGPADLSRNYPADFRDVKLSELFANGHDELIVVHLMFAANDDVPCVMCSMWTDGYNAIAPHVRQRANFVVVAKKEIGAGQAARLGPHPPPLQPRQQLQPGLRRGARGRLAEPRSECLHPRCRGRHLPSVHHLRRVAP